MKLTDSDYVINDLYDLILLNHGDNRPSGKELLGIIQSALKLQELVKKLLKDNEEFIHMTSSWGSYDGGRCDELDNIVSLVKQSEDQA